MSTPSDINNPGEPGSVQRLIYLRCYRDCEQIGERCQKLFVWVFGDQVLLNLSLKLLGERHEEY